MYAVLHGKLYLIEDWDCDQFCINGDDWYYPGQVDKVYYKKDILELIKRDFLNYDKGRYLGKDI